jgi:Helix-turn-helix domain
MAREPEEIAERRRALGAQLATFRLAAELTQGQLGKAAICDRTVIAHIEKGRARGDERFWRTVDEVCRAGGVLLAGYLELAAAKAEHQRRQREQRLSNVRAKATELRRQVGTQAPPVQASALDDLRRTVLGSPDWLEVGSGADRSAGGAGCEASVVDAHRMYQLADYDESARLLSHVFSRAEAMAGATSMTAPTMTSAYLASAKLAVKLGDAALAWVAADRCLRLAAETERPSLAGIAQYQIACALLAAGHLADAEQTVATAADRLASCVKPCRDDVLSVRGALLLLLSITVARRGDAVAARANLRAAGQMAAQLGQDANWLWTAFGPTNVDIHELSVHVALGDTGRAMRLGEAINTDRLPSVLRGRRSQVHLELATAAAGQGDDCLAVLHLLEAERVATQAVSRNTMARELLVTLLSRERKSATPGLRALAARAGVLG